MKMKVTEKLHTLSQYLKKRLKEPLPGKEAQYRMAGIRRIEQIFPDADISRAKLSGVLILFYPKEEQVYTVLIRRQIYNGVHSGQLGFPGGRKEASDQDLTRTALRESEEETGIHPEDVFIQGHLTELFIPPSNSLVMPSVGISTFRPDFVADPQEVAEIIEIPLAEFFKPEANTRRHVTAGYWNAEVPCYSIHDLTIWGATAMIISELIEILREYPDYSIWME